MSKVLTNKNSYIIVLEQSRRVSTRLGTMSSWFIILMPIHWVTRPSIMKTHLWSLEWELFATRKKVISEHEWGLSGRRQYVLLVRLRVGYFTQVLNYVENESLKLFSISLIWFGSLSVCSLISNCTYGINSVAKNFADRRTTFAKKVGLVRRTILSRGWL